MLFSFVLYLIVDILELIVENVCLYSLLHLALKLHVSGVIFQNTIQYLFPQIRLAKVLKSLQIVHVKPHFQRVH